MAVLVTSVAAYAIALGVTATHPSAANTGFLLKGQPVPEPSTLGAYVVNRTAAVQLGKALFWDEQAGSDGTQACASCHFNAGADNRVNNTLDPGKDGVFNVTPGANGTTTAADYPFHKLANVNTRTPVLSDKDDVHGSQGVYLRNFISVGSIDVDSCADVSDATFQSGGVNVRRVTGRNTPTTINAVFNFRNFWDGRGREVFNGANPEGDTDPNARIYLAASDGSLVPTAVLIDNASAASQATGPTLSGTEMSCDGRHWPQVGRKLLSLTPLGKQTVDPHDSLLGAYAVSSVKGLTTSYRNLITQAFQPNLWNGTGTVPIGGEAFTQMEANFSLFWGLAIQMYESTLVSDDTPLDRFLSGNSSALTAQQQQGMALFQGSARCTSCHVGPLLTDATGTALAPAGGHAFVNVAVRPTSEDGGDVLVPNQGRFKTPTLRNVEFTGPYFHNGAVSTLKQVIDFYNRGGNFPDGFTDSSIRPLNLTESQKDSLVAFLLALSDDRVRNSAAPFDHPSLCIPDGETVDTTARTSVDRMTCLPAVGAGGGGTPLTTFLGLSPFQR